MILTFFTVYSIFTITVNNAELVKIGGAVEQDAARILRDVPGVMLEPPQPTLRGDVIIRAGEVAVVVELKARRLTNAAGAQQVIAHARELPANTHLVVVAQSITEEAREQLTQAGVGFIDATGAIRLNLPGLVVWRDGQRPGVPARTTTQLITLSGKAGVAAQALLREPARPWSVHDLADHANVSVGLVHRLFIRLESEGLLQAEGRGPRKTRRVTTPTALLDLWAEEMRDRDVRQLRAYRLARDAGALAATVSKALTDTNIDHAVTGAAAAARLAPFVTAIPIIEVWVPELNDLQLVATAARAPEVAEGHNLIFRSARADIPLTFRKRDKNVWIADTLRVYLDLRADPRRGREQAARLREGVIRL